MNANKKIVIAAIGGVLLLLFIFAAIMLFRGIRQFGVAEANLAAARSTLDGFYKRQPFASDDNVATIKSNAESIQEWTRDLLDVAKRKQVDPDPTKSPSVFINMLAKVRNSLQAKAQQSGVEIDPEFGFGFDRYVKGEPATTDFVPRLIQQLMIINGVCNILIDEKAKEIQSIEREQFDGVRGAAASGQRARRSRRVASAAPNVGMLRASAVPAGKPSSMAGKFEEDALDTKMKFVFSFTSKEHSLLNILNKLTRSEMFIVVTSVDVESLAPEEDDLEKALEARVGSTSKRRGTSSVDGLFGDPKTADVKPVSAFKRTPSRQERVILGGKAEHPIKVRIEMEVYRFK